MKMNCHFTAGASVLALAAAAALGAAASAQPISYPYKQGATPVDQGRPLHHRGPHTGLYVDKNPASKSGAWTSLAGLPFTHGPWGAMQLTDGTVIVQDYCTTPNQWYRLTPNKKGNYASGKWSKIATMPSGYAPLFFAQQVLSDGRVIINGGEYNASSNSCGGGVWTNQGALYDPVKNSWTSVSPPSGWSAIGDAESIILPNGTYMLANCCDSPGQAALASISGTTVSWSTQSTISCGGNPCNDEEGWTALPDGNVLMVDVWNLTGGDDDYWIYNTSAGAWNLQGHLPNFLSETSTRELGAAALTPAYGSQGTIIQFSANSSSGVNDVYSVSGNSWTTGPVMKVGSTIYDCADAPAATLPDGNVLVQASPDTFDTPSHFWEWNVGSGGTVTATQVNDPEGASSTSSFESNLLVLPTGQVLWDNSQVTPNQVALYKPKGSPQAAWLPVVSSVSASLTVGSTGNAISGTNFNGFDLGGVYGDDAQSATNFPLVRITNTSSGDVCYARSYDFSTMGVWTTGATNAEFDIPSTCQTGASTLQVVVNGIASTGVSVTLNS